MDCKCTTSSVYNDTGHRRHVCSRSQSKRAVEGVKASKEEGNADVSFEMKDGDTDKCRTSCHKLFKEPMAYFSVWCSGGRGSEGMSWVSASKADLLLAVACLSS